MKKLTTSLLATCICLGSFYNTGILSISAKEVSSHENPVIETREVDWPDYNYGNWKDVAEHPERHQKVVRCIGKVIKDMKIDMTTAAVLAALGKGASLGTLLGVEAGVRFTACMVS
ncbi:hypothetical protein [Allobaculum stercoricanis]|uniref:hypothetical protein n=1 Tax=Allobaculum stercoricanis TaxID=174709 RepID=UPI00037126E3|nr:hypothetical protein [Allobaculum stercoricanis]